MAAVYSHHQNSSSPQMLNAWQIKCLVDVMNLQIINSAIGIMRTGSHFYPAILWEWINNYIAALWLGRCCV